MKSDSCRPTTSGTAQPTLNRRGQAVPGVPEPVARESELESFAQAIERSRFVLLTGPQGVGKTHLLRWAVPQYANRPVEWLALQPGAHLASELQATFGAAAATLPALATAIDDADVLLVLDDLHALPDVEHGTALLIDLLGVCPNLSVIASSRIRPDVYGLAELPMPLLGVPAYDETTLPEIRRTRAFELWSTLFAREHGRPPSAAEVRKGATVVRAVDGLPLGIVTAVQQPDALPGLLRECADHVYRTLSPREALALSALGQLQRHWSMDTARLVLEPWFDTAEAEKCIDRLADLSAVQRYRVNDKTVLFRITRNLRARGDAYLRERGLHDRAELAYCTAMRTIAREAYVHSTTPLYSEYQHLLILLVGDMELAWRKLVQRGLLDDALAFTADVWPYWNVSFNMAHYQQVVEEILRLCTTESPARVLCLHTSGVIYHVQGEWQKSEARHREAIALAERLEDTELRALAWYGLGQSALHSGDSPLAERALLMAEKLYTDANVVRGLAEQQVLLSIFYWNQQRLDEASKIAEVALLWFQAVGEEIGMATGHALVGRVRIDMGDEHRAAFHLMRALELGERVQDQIVLAESLEGLAKLAAGQKRYVVASRLLGAAAGKRARVQHPGWPITFQPMKLTIRDASQELGEEFDREFARGRRISWPNVLEQLSELTVPVSQVPPPVTLADQGREALNAMGLTAREQQVLVMMAVGAPDREIAESLKIGVRTVHSHVHNVISKLGASSRAAAVGFAWRMGVLK